MTSRSMLGLVALVVACGGPAATGPGSRAVESREPAQTSASSDGTSEPPPVADTTPPESSAPEGPLAEGECRTVSDCTSSYFASPFTSARDCACRHCATSATTSAQRDAIDASYTAVCAGWLRTHDCPPVSCAESSAVLSCVERRCIFVGGEEF